MPERGRYSHRFKFDVPEPCNEAIPESDAFYTLNVLLGFSQLPGLGGHEHADIRKIYDACCREVGNPRVRTYMYGMGLWAGAKLDIAPPGLLIDRVMAFSASPSTLHRLSAQDIGMLVSGTAAMALKEGERWRAAANIFAAHLSEHYHHPTTPPSHHQFIL